MYNRFIETDADAKREHDATLKKNAADRLRANQEWNRKNRPKKIGRINFFVTVGDAFACLNYGTK